VSGVAQRDRRESVADAATGPVAREARNLGRGRAPRTPAVMLAVLGAGIAVAAGIVILVALLISSNS
jgi:hypothetical protein